MSFAKRLNDIQSGIAAACARAGRDPASVHILAVSKFQSDALIEEAYAAGVRDFGENYVQELVDKRSRLGHLKDARWHLIGHLQSNKIKLALSHAHSYHALDSEKAIAHFARQWAALGMRVPWPVFVQVNLENEASKSGASPEELAGLVARLQHEPSLSLQGLMCIPEPRPSAEQMRPAFRRLAELAKSLESRSGKPLQLSMGMSEDYEIAVEEGAHWVRIGRKLFGERVQKS